MVKKILALFISLSALNTINKILFGEAQATWDHGKSHTFTSMTFPGFLPYSTTSPIRGPKLTLRPYFMFLDFSYPYRFLGVAVSQVEPHSMGS